MINDTMDVGDTKQARLIYSDGRIEYYGDNQQLAYKVWLAMDKGIRIAFRGKDDIRPVYSWDCVDVLA